MNIRRLETFTTGHLSILRLTTDDGAVGFGQLSPFDADISAVVFHRHVAPHALGSDPDDIDGLVDRIVEANYKFPGTYVLRALTGLDTALWDLRGRLAGKSVCELIGGRPREIRAYASSMRRDISPEDEAARLARLRDECGFGAFKIKIGKTCGHDADAAPGRTEAVVRTVRRTLGDDADLLVDANSGYTPAKAIEVGRMLEAHGVCHFEEPCPWWELDWTAEVTRALDVPVAGGEQDCFLQQWRRIIDTPAVDIVQPDVCYLGGMTRALRVAAMAHEAGLPCVPHSSNPSMVTVFSMHLLAAVPNAGPYLEFGIEPNEWLRGLFDPPLAVRDGVVAVTDAPGWGVTPNADWLARADRQVSETD